jgi:putative endonuclease
LGQKGEAEAVKFLEKNSYEILDINIRRKNSEADIVAWDKKHNEIAFIEVKARSSNFYGDPSTAVTKKKIDSMEKVARAYLKIKRIFKNYRFDIITITPEGIKHFENVSWL